MLKNRGYSGGNFATAPGSALLFVPDPGAKRTGQPESGELELRPKSPLGSAFSVPFTLLPTAMVVLFEALRKCSLGLVISDSESAAPKCSVHLQSHQSLEYTGSKETTLSSSSNLASFPYFWRASTDQGIATKSMQRGGSR
jgi:hypothetical protein